MHRRTAALVGAALAAATFWAIAPAAPAAADDRADAVEAALEAWRPLEAGTWSAGNPAAVASEPQTGCHPGTYRQFSRGTDGAMIELDWADCGDADSASAAVEALGQTLGLVAAPDSPDALLDGLLLLLGAGETLLLGLARGVVAGVERVDDVVDGHGDRADLVLVVVLDALGAVTGGDGPQRVFHFPARLGIG